MVVRGLFIRKAKKPGRGSCAIPQRKRLHTDSAPFGSPVLQERMADQMQILRVARNTAGKPRGQA